MALIQVDDSNFQKISNFTNVPPDQIQDTDLITGLHNGGNANFRIYDIVSKVMAGIDIDPGQDPGYDPGGDLGEEVTYSVIIDHSKSDPVKMVTYADDALALRPGWNNVKDKPIFKKIRPCVLKDGQVLYYLNPDNYAYKYNVNEGITYSQIQEALQTKAWYVQTRFVCYSVSDGKAAATFSTKNYTYSSKSSPVDGDDFPDYTTNNSFSNANYTRAALISVELQHGTYESTKRTVWRFVIYNETTGAIAFPGTPQTSGYSEVAYAGFVTGTEFSRPSYLTTQKVLGKHFETNMPMFNVTSQDDVTTAGTPVNDWLVYGNLHDTINVIGYGNAGSQAEAADITTVGNDVMIEYPERLGYKFTWLDENRLKVSVTNRPNAAGFCYDAFSYSQYNDCDKIYYGVYRAHINNNAAYSRSGYSPGEEGFDSWGQYFRVRGAGYSMQTWSARILFACLYIIAHTSLDSQSVSGIGFSASSSVAYQTTGGANDIGFDGEKRTTPIPAYNVAMCALGLENPWGRGEFVDGIRYYNNRVYVSSSETGTDIEIYRSSSNRTGYFNKSLGTNYAGFFPPDSSFAGSTTTYYCDKGSIVSVGVGRRFVVGDSNTTVYGSNSGDPGLFSIANVTTSLAALSRLMYFHRG